MLVDTVASTILVEMTVKKLLKDLESEREGFSEVSPFI